MLPKAPKNKYKVFEAMKYLRRQESPAEAEMTQKAPKKMFSVEKVFFRDGSYLNTKDDLNCDQQHQQQHPVSTRLRAPGTY